MCSAFHSYSEARSRSKRAPVLTLVNAHVRQPHQHIAVARARRAQTSEHEDAQLIERRDQRRVPPEPTLIQRYALAALTVFADHERVAPLRGPPDVNVVTLALAMHRARRAELHVGRDE